jgi:hypothetical protein
MTSTGNYIPMIELQLGVSGGAAMATQLQLQAAIEVLRQPIQDRQRNILIDPSGIIMLADDSGAEPIESFDDVTVCHHILIHLDIQRQARELARQLAIKRSSFKLVAGGQCAD